MSPKLCVDCKEEIKPDAKRCPHCGSWQSRWLSDMQSPKVTFGFLAFIFLGFYLFLSYWIPSSVVERPKFSDFQQELVIVDSEMRTYRQGEYIRIAVMGQLANRSPHAWERFRFHVELFNSEDELIDILEDSAFSLVLPPDSQTNFRIVGSASREPEEYVKHTVTIRAADVERDY